MKLRFWGVRGGLPAPGRSTEELGGNTPCVQLILDSNKSLIFDSGTGIIEYASKGINKKEEKEFNLFITHFHWDHIQGFPFFFPIHNKAVTINIYSPFSVETLKSNISFLFDGTYSPLRNINNLPAKINFNEITENGVQIYNSKITYKETFHTDKCYAYKVESPKFTFVYVMDHETTNKDYNDSIIEFIRNADVVIHDSEYTKGQYKRLAGWGHSSIDSAIENGIKAGVKVLFLSSHRSSHSDDFLRLYLTRLVRHLKSDEGIKLPIIRLAQENRIFEVNKLGF